MPISGFANSPNSTALFLKTAVHQQHHEGWMAEPGGQRRPRFAGLSPPRSECDHGA